MPTPLPFSPFIDVSLVDMEHRFVLDEHRFLQDITEQHLPIFITDPSPDFIAACQRELLPMLEQYARRG